MGPPATTGVFSCDLETAGAFSLSLHDALPIYASAPSASVAHASLDKVAPAALAATVPVTTTVVDWPDRKSARLNSSNRTTSYSVYCCGISGVTSAGTESVTTTLVAFEVPELLVTVMV